MSIEINVDEYGFAKKPEPEKVSRDYAAEYCKQIDDKIDAEITNRQNADTTLQTNIDGKADAGHTHDGRYYTESEVNTLLSGKANSSHQHSISNVTNLQSALDGKSNTGHTHDDRYYTTNEVNTLLAGKSNSDHNHDFNYFTKTEVNNKLNLKVSKETGKGLSTEDYTSAEKTKLTGIESGAKVNIIETVKVDGTPLNVTDRTVDIDLSGKAIIISDTIPTASSEYEDKIYLYTGTTTQTYTNNKFYKCVEIETNVYSWQEIGYATANDLLSKLDVIDITEDELENIFDETPKIYRVNSISGVIYKCFVITSKVSNHYYQYFFDEYGFSFRQDDGYGEYSGWNFCEFETNKVSSQVGLNENSTDQEYPSAKCVYEALQAKQDALTPGAGIDITNNVISAIEQPYTLIEKIIVGYSKVSTEPENWETVFTNYYKNTGTAIEPVYTQLTDSTAPAFVANMYYSYNDNFTDDLKIHQKTDETEFNFKAIRVVIKTPTVPASPPDNPDIFYGYLYFYGRNNSEIFLDYNVKGNTYGWSYQMEKKLDNSYLYQRSSYSANSSDGYGGFRVLKKDTDFGNITGIKFYINKRSFSGVTVEIWGVE